MNSHNGRLAVKAEIFDKQGNLKRTYDIPKPSADAKLRITHMDKDGNVKQVHEQPFRSFVSNFARVLNNSFFNIDNSTAGATIDKIIEAVTGGATNLAAATHLLEVDEGALTASAQTAFGIWVGDKDNTSGLGLTQESGIQASEAFDNYMLRALVLADGGSPDTGLEYRATTVTLSGNNITIARRFQNDSAVSIFIDEIGLVAKSGTDYFLIARDVVNIGNETVVLDYQFEIPTTDVFVVEYVFSISDASEFTLNYLKMIDSMLRGTTASSNPRDVNGNYYAVNFCSARTQKDLLAAANAITHGIVISGYTETNYENQGDGGPTNVNMYKLVNTVLLDSELDYGAVTPITLTQVTPGGGVIPYTQIGAYRDFENVITERVHVYESALIIKEAAATHYYMIARTPFGSGAGIVVDPGEILRISAYLQFPLQNNGPIVEA